MEPDRARPPQQERARLPWPRAWRRLRRLHPPPAPVREPPRPPAVVLPQADWTTAVCQMCAQPCEIRTKQLCTLCD
eukprot:7122010-Lingulodinium_polyedra.AAC.1